MSAARVRRNEGVASDVVAFDETRGARTRQEFALLLSPIVIREIEGKMSRKRDDADTNLFGAENHVASRRESRDASPARNIFFTKYIMILSTSKSESREV